LALTTKTRKVPYADPPSADMMTWVDTLTGRKAYQHFTVSNSTAFDSLAGTQVTTSEAHTGWRSRPRDRFYGDIGGEFTSTRTYAYGNLPNVEGVVFEENTGYPSYDTNVCVYSGPVLPANPFNMGFPTNKRSTDSQLAVYGTEAIARCSPSNPTANVTTFLGETLSEGLPHFVGHSLKELAGMNPKKLRKALSGEFLNYEFGWLPFVSDLRSLSQSLLNSHKILSQYSRGSGTLTRRRYVFPDVKTTSIDRVLSNAVPWTLIGSSVMTRFGPHSGQVFCETKTLQSRWFSGAFTYYIPPPSSLIGDIDRKVIFAKKLLGASLTPDSVWNLAPWSWLVDWFTDTGDVLKNLDNWIIDNQVLAYGYIMEHTMSTNAYTFVGDTSLRTSVPVPTVTFVNECKLRRKATPYGFGFTWDTLSHLQQAILVALGLSRWRK
jgi:hypothetical protein